MVYTPTVWKDRDVQNPRTYSVRENEDGTVTLFDAPGEIYEQGTPVNAANLNKIEEELTKNGGGLEIGDIGFAAFGINETLNERRYLNGQVISQSQFEAFTKMIKERAALYPSLVASETNWQAEVTNSKLGQCGKFVIDDTLGTIRLPKVVNINGLQDLALLGNIKAESLPNITGETGGWVGGGISGDNGALYTITKGVQSWGGATSSGIKSVAIDASRSSSTYQDNAPVQQEAIQYPYFIQVATGTEESVDVTREIELNNPFSLLDYKWSEYELNNASWLISNGAFHSGTVYKSVYELLLKIQNGTETKDGVSVKLSTEAYEDTDFVLNTADTTFRLPIKVKLASGSAVVGNGMTLGLTNGTQLAGMFKGDVDISGISGVYGKNVGTPSSGTGLTSDKSLGVTTDPLKSGIETSSSGLKLYFYVGETVQDANVIVASQVLTRVAELSDSYISGLGTPDWTAGVAKTLNTTYTAEVAGMLLIQITRSDTGRTLTIDGKKLSLINNAGACSLLPTYFVGKGSVYSLTGTTGTYEFYPLKGVN